MHSMRKSAVPTPKDTFRWEFDWIDKLSMGTLLASPLCFWLYLYIHQNGSEELGSPPHGETQAIDAVLADVETLAKELVQCRRAVRAQRRGGD